MNQFAKKALDLINRGYTPIPCIEKSPTVKGWQTLRNVTADQIKEWSDRGWFQNIAVLCGEASGNLVIIDFDGLEGYETFVNLFPDLANTFTVLTGSGNGKHVYFKVDLLPDSTAAMNVRLQDSEVNIELRANGRACMVPPSIHPKTGNVYTVCNAVPVQHLTDISSLVKWIHELSPQPERRHAAGEQTHEINPEVKEALRRHFEGQPGAKISENPVSGTWINCPCPVPGHSHGDTEFSFGYHPESGTGHCFIHGVILTKALCEYVGLDYKRMGGLFKPDETPRQTRQRSQQQQGENQLPPVVEVTRPEPPEDFFVSDAEALEQYIDEIEGRRFPDIIPLVNPYNFLHKYGGFAHIVTPGHLVYMASVSGGTKTIGLETGWTNYQRAGIHSGVYTPEWVDMRGAVEMAARAVQRAGGASVQDKLLQTLYQVEEQQNRQMRIGVPIPQDRVRESVQRARAMQEWAGRVYYLKEPGLSAEAICDRFERMYDRLIEQQGIVLRAIWIDFAQLLWLENEGGSGRIWMEVAITKIKDLCRRKNLVGFISSQMKKLDAEMAKDGGAFDASMMQWLSDQQANLVVMFAPKYEDGLRVKNTLIGRILKNSSAPVPDDPFDIQVNYKRLAWKDEPYSSAGRGGQQALIEERQIDIGVSNRPT